MADDLIIDEIAKIGPQALINTVATLQAQHTALMLPIIFPDKLKPLKQRQEWTGHETYPGMGLMKYLDAHSPGGFDAIFPSGRRKVSFS